VTLADIELLENKLKQMSAAHSRERW